MKHTHRSTLIIVVIALVCTLLATSFVQAVDYYYRWTTPLPDVRCSTDGAVFLSTTDLTYEYNLPTGAMVAVYYIDNGVSFYDGTYAVPSGTASVTVGGYNTSAPSYPLVEAIHFDTIIDGEIIYTSSIIFTCTGPGIGTAEIINGAIGAAADACLPLPVGSVVGSMPLNTQAFYAPGQEAAGVVINAGTYWVLGQDENHEFYKILLACQYLWVPVELDAAELPVALARSTTPHRSCRLGEQERAVQQLFSRRRP